MKGINRRTVLLSIAAVFLAALFLILCLLWPVVRSAAGVRYLEDGFHAPAVNFYGASESLALGVETAEALLKQMNVGSAKDRLPTQVSGGEAQLIPLAPGETRCRFFTDDLSAYRGDVPQIACGEI